MAENLVIDNYKTEFVNGNRGASMLLYHLIINVEIKILACLSDWIQLQTKLIQNMGI